MKFFDSLTHVSPDGSWLDHNRYDSGLGRLIEDIDKFDTFRACLVAIAGYQRNEDLITLTKQHPEMFVPIAGFNPVEHTTNEDRRKALAAIASAGFPGIKLHPRLNEYDPLDQRCIDTISHASELGMVVFLDTLFRQKNISTAYAPDVVDRLVHDCSLHRLILLHGGASSLLDMFEMVRMHETLILDLSFTLLRYAGSSLDQDIVFVCRNLDQRVTIGSDFPEYLPSAAYRRIDRMLADLPREKRDKVLYQNLEHLFSSWKGLSQEIE